MRKPKVSFRVQRTPLHLNDGFVMAASVMCIVEWPEGYMRTHIMTLAAFDDDEVRAACVRMFLSELRP